MKNANFLRWTSVTEYLNTVFPKLLAFLASESFGDIQLTPCS